MNRKQIAVSAHNITLGLSRIEDAIVAITTELDNLDQEATQLSDRWSGDAREAYTAAHAAWQEDLAHMVKLVNTLTRIAHTTTDGFTKVEGQNAGAWK